MLEKDVEKRLIKPVRELGGLCLKFETPGYTGVPDRLLLFPGGRVVFVETKSPGRHERPRQEYVQEVLRRMGFTVYSSIDSRAKVSEVIEACRRLVYGENV